MSGSAWPETFEPGGTVDHIQQRFREMVWHYGEGDQNALEELERRIANAGRSELPSITYSDLARGVSFNLANVKDSPHTIDVSNWQALDRTIIGEFLGVISMRSYDRGQFFASALVVDKHEGKPGLGFNRLLMQLDLIPNVNSDRAVELWAEHIAKAHAWFTGRRRRSSS